MSVSGWEQLLFVAAVTAVAAPLLGRYLAATFRGMVSVSGTGSESGSAAKNRAPGDRVFLPVERLVYRTLGWTRRAAGPGGPTRWRCWPSAWSLRSCCTPSCGCKEYCQGTRRTPRGCPLYCRSTPLSASSPALTGRPTRGNASQLPGADGRAGGGAGRGPRHRREGAHDRQLTAPPAAGIGVPGRERRQPGGNMEGKQTLFGPEASALMTVGTMGTTGDRLGAR